MKLIRLPSGPLACVFPVDLDAQQASERGAISGVFRAFSGSVEADGASEAQAIEALDAEVRRLSVPPPGDIEDLKLRQGAAPDVPVWDGASRPEVAGRYPRYSEHPTIPAPASSSRR